VSDPQSAWQEWLDSLDMPRTAAAESLRAQFSALGVTDPVDLIKSEVMEDLPQLARFVLLRSLWRGAIDSWTEPGSLDQLPAAQRILATGADREDPFAWPEPLPMRRCSLRSTSWMPAVM
jgi:hypothetical protein